MTPCQHTINTSETSGAPVAEAPAAPDAAPDAEPAPAPAPLPPVPAGARFGALLRRACTVPRLLLLLIAALAAVGYAWSLDSEGLETYYAAGVRSMAGSWHAFFYGAYDPAAATTLDKLPGAFWVQALSVRAFGYSVWAMVLPQVIEGTLAVLVLYRAVRRIGGAAPALIAAAVLAASPVTLATTRGNLSEPLYLLLLLLAADAVLRVVLLGRRRSGWAAALWVALAFQAKMTEAWFLLPALVLALVTAAPRGARLRALLRGLLLSTVAAALSLSWMLFFTLTPAADRPVADGSANNSVFEQVFSYNGGQRLNQGVDFGLPPLTKPDPALVAHLEQYLTPEHGLGVYPASTFAKPAWDRLLSAPLGADTGWLLPLALAGAVLLLLVLPRRLPGALTRRAAGPLPEARAELRRMRPAVALWTAWLLVAAVAFSGVGALHDYYLATMVPAIGALTGLTVTTLWRRSRGLLAVLLVLQGVWSAGLLYGQGPVLRWLLVLAGIAAGAVLLLHGRARGGLRRPARALAAALTLAVLVAGPVTAGVWLLARSAGPFDTPFLSSGTFAQPAGPAPHNRRAVTGVYAGSYMSRPTAANWSAMMKSGADLNALLGANHHDVLVFQATAADSYVMGGLTHIRVIGGFTGNLPSPSADDVAALISSGQISSALVPGPDVVDGDDPRVRVVKDRCMPHSANQQADLLVYLCP
ncbi:ArnT family glycosyltransferase [Kitasatospora sp. NPDC006697]|uniref:ArnT family glycosyltransferase n=1 Tax=Kitasatospora sp. NPDC006697 TaxID=3364020 RepID=UPI0036927BB5